MRILKIANIPDNPNTGMGRVMYQSAQALRAMGHDVELMLSSDVPRDRLGRFDRFGFPVALVREVRRRLRDGQRFDVVEIHEPSAAWYCWQRLRDKSLPPCVVMSHGLEEVQWRLRLRLDQLLEQKTSFKSRLLVPATLLSQARYALRHSQGVMCLNSLDEQFLRCEVRLPASRISRVRHGVDERFFARAQASANDGETAQPRLLFVGSWLEKKGRRILAEVFTRLKSRHPDLKMSLVGTGVPEADVLAFFEPLLHSAIVVHPYAEDAALLPIYASHGVFVFPTYFEPWGLVLTEAAAAGLAIVTTNAGGPADFFHNGEDALLVPPADADALCEEVEKLLRDPALRERLGAAARERAREFTWRAAAQSHLDAYQKVIRSA